MEGEWLLVILLLDNITFVHTYVHVLLLPCHIILHLLWLSCSFLFTDYEKVITHSIHQSNYEEALHVLTSKALDVVALDISDKDKKARFSSFATLYYKFSPILVKKCAEKTVDAWIKMDKFLEAKKLIPALIQCNQSADSKQVIGIRAYIHSLLYFPPLWI